MIHIPSPARAIAFLTGFLALPFPLVAAAPPPPNILWITCEDISPNLGCYGDAYARTPHLDRLAAQATRYNQAFAVTGVCAPNRSCLITGVFPSTLGSHNMRCATRLPPQIQCFPEYLRTAGYYTSNNVKTDYNFPPPPAAWHECSAKAHFRNRPTGQPFFSVFNFTVCHESQIRVPEKVYARNTVRLTPDQRHAPAEVPLPPYHPDTPEVRRDWARYHDNITAMDYLAGDILRQLDEDGLAEDTIVFFFSDHGAGMPGCKKWVWESGLHVPLLIRFPAKYRAWAPAGPGGTCDRIVNFVDFAPTVLSLAGAPIPAHMQGTAFLGPAADAPRERFHAIRDRMAERFDIVRVVRDGRYQYIRNFLPHLSWSQFVSYTEEMPTMQVWRRRAAEGRLDPVQARYFLPRKPVEELYDVTADPHQVRNLAEEPAMADVLKTMRMECFEWMRRTGDLGLLPEFELERRSIGRTPWDLARDPEANPVDRLIDAAETANAMDPARTPDLIRLLEDADPAVRFWGATGLLALAPHATTAGSALRKALADDGPDVRIAAAEALAVSGDVGAALPVLIEALQHDAPVIRLRALNALDRLGPAARPALDAIRRTATTERSHLAEYVNRLVEYAPARIDAGER